MQPITPMAPRGRQTIPLGLVASHAAAEACPKGAAVDKWAVLRAVETAANALRLPKSRVAVLDALLSFCPAQELVAGADLVVWPSNSKLATRAHVSAATTTRCLNHLAEAGLILRRDSPNCKRYARKGQGGAIAQAFGFDLTPLVVMADELARLAAEVTQREVERNHLRQSISVNQREIRAILATASTEGIPGDWAAYETTFAPLSGRVPRSISFDEAAAIAGDLDRLAISMRAQLVSHVERQKMTSSAHHTEEHIQNSTTQPITELEPGFPNTPSRTEEPPPETSSPPPSKSYPLGMVLDACRHLADISGQPIKTWQDFTAAVEIVRPYLGISPSAWDEAKDTFGYHQAAVIVAAINERSDAIASAGGYLRALTRKARAGEFSLGPILMALIRANLTRKRA